MCCACAGSCNHVGNHSFCAAHGGQMQPTVVYVGASWNVGAEELAWALAALLEDTQHAEHTCHDDPSCPVDAARRVLARYRGARIGWTMNYPSTTTTATTAASPNAASDGGSDG